MSFEYLRTIFPSIYSRWITAIVIRGVTISMVAVPALAIACAIVFRSNKFAPVIFTIGVIYEPMCKHLLLPKLWVWGLGIMERGKKALDINMAKMVHEAMAEGLSKQEIVEALMEGGMAEDEAERIIKLASSPKLFGHNPNKDR